ncbi:MAG TPA: penicillin-binding transpeptidase domain-containing protein [Actinomycetota bacterium]|nr:penicillin-binding transpeptidase domain-containing protein [Actinomycetota bacterium]
MDRQIRRLGIALVALFAVLFGQVAYVQVFAAERIADSPGNATRQIRAEFEVERGQIIAADRRTVLARSVEAGPNQVYRFRREYPEGDLFGHVTGYYSRIFGRAGIEQAFNQYLAGTAPELAVSNVTDLILGRTKKGASVYTTIWPELQRVAREALGGQPGAVAAIDPRTGDVLALYSNPGFDPNVLSSGSDRAIRSAWDELNGDASKPLLSKAFQELFLPGSGFKIVTASAELERDASVDTPWPNPHVLDLPTTDDDLTNYGGALCAGGASQVTTLVAFQQSCNVTFGVMGLDLYGERTGNFGLSDQADAYGFCMTNPPEVTGCDEPRIPFALPFQNGRFPEAGYFADRIPARAYAAVGLDNVLTNPLHMALAAGAIANGGEMMAPRIVTSVRDAQGRTVREFGTESVSRPISRGTAAEMTQLMLSVTQGGTASSAFSGFGIPVAGKTGTATTGDDSPPNAWFSAFAPAGTGEPPRIAVSVIVLEGGGLGDAATGGQIAAPIARAVIDAYLDG